MRTWPESLRGLKSPPVVDIALVVQFAQIPGLTMAHAGVFWKNFLDPSYSVVRAAMPVPDSFETFNTGWTPPQFQFQFNPNEAPETRAQIVDQINDRIVQIQNNRLIYSWRKSNTAYPSFQQLCSEFRRILGLFQAFLQQHQLDRLLPNQWEVWYTDHIPKGRLWQTPADFHSVFPGIFPEPSPSPGLPLESQAVERRYEIESKRGRVHLWARPDTIMPGVEAISLRWVARGTIPAGATADDSILAGLQIGHEAIGRVFVEVVSDKALSDWKE